MQKVVSTTQGTEYQNCPSDDEINSFIYEIEKTAWTGLMGTDLAKKLVERYMSCTGEAMELTEAEFLIINPRIEYSKTEADNIMFFMALGKKCRDHPVRDSREGKWPAASDGATLGFFFIDYQVTIDCRYDQSNSEYSLNMLVDMKYIDDWDFNKANHRAEASEFKVEVARKYLTGKPFRITGSYQLVDDFSLGELDGIGSKPLGSLISKRFVKNINDLRRPNKPEYSAFGKFMHAVLGIVNF